MYTETEHRNEMVEAADTDQSSAFGSRFDLQPPPFAEVVDGPDYDNSAISIEINSNHRTKGKLSLFDTDSEILGFKEASKTTPTELEFSSIKFMRIEKPYQLTLEGPAKEENLSEIPVEIEARSFQVFFKDGTELSGKTYGSRVDKNGIHFYEQQKKGRKWRYCGHLFVSKSAVENFIIGEQIGGMLVRENAISQSDLDEVLEQQHNERSELLGDYLVKTKVVNPEELKASLSRQQKMPNLKLGEILTTESLITETQLQDALKTQKQRRKISLGEILVDKGIIHLDQIQQCLAKKLGIPFINLQKFTIEPDVIQIVSTELAFNHKVIPLNFNDGKLVVAIEDPMDWQVIDVLRFNLKMHIEPVMASAADINWALHFYYTAEDLLSLPVDDESNDTEDNNFDPTIFSVNDISQITSNSATTIINKIIEDAHRQKVTDIHIEPGIADQKVTVRFRKDGALAIYYKFPAGYRAVFVSRLKVMAGMNVTDKLKPQEGKIVFRNYGSLDIELRVATIPVAGGVEDVVIKLLSSGRCMPVNAIGLSSDNLDHVLDMVSRPQGLFLICGPASSGKSTTLHSLLNHLNQPDRKIWTAEDPVRITQPGIRQVDVNDNAKVSFADAVKSFLNADPDIIMISDMRDPETAKIAIEAALTGQMVMSTLHTSNAAESLARMLDMGMDRFNFADALLGVLTQRLVRTLCISCKKPYRPEKKELVYLASEYCREMSDDGSRKDPTNAAIKQQISEWEEKFALTDGITFYKTPGCKDCLDTGYRGHIGVHELMPNTQATKRLIFANADLEHFRAEAIRSAVRTHKQDGIEKILLGYTDYSQVRTL